VEFWLDTRLVSEANVREHWSHRSKRASRQRSLVALTLLQVLGARESPDPRNPTRRKRWYIQADPKRAKWVHFTAYVGRPFDSDNLVGALKHVRDGLVEAQLIHGDAPRHGHEFTYEQRAGIPTAKQGVRISVRLRPDA
jgi:hypothetical protein